MYNPRSPESGQFLREIYERNGKCCYSMRKCHRCPSVGDARQQKGSHCPSAGDDRRQEGSRCPSASDARRQKGSHCPSAGNDRRQKGSRCPSAGDDRGQKGSHCPSAGDDRRQKGSRCPSTGNDGQLLRRLRRHSAGADTPDLLLGPRSGGFEQSGEHPRRAHDCLQQVEPFGPPRLVPIEPAGRPAAPARHTRPPAGSPRPPFLPRGGRAVRGRSPAGEWREAALFRDATERRPADRRSRGPPRSLSLGLG
jgi:hypothetical protein